MSEEAPRSLTLPLEDLLRDDELTVARGERLGRYELVFEGPSGGMATVFMAVKPGPSGFRKVVALKKIHPHLAKSRQFVDMFIDEARVASLLDHPFVCGVQDFGEVDGAHFLVMEYLHGESFRDLLRAALRRGEGIPPAIIARIFADLSEGLYAAHCLTDDRGESLGLIHRDISPSNLFVLYDGSVRVTDFGIARMRGAVHHTATGSVRGKLHYMSPEHVRGLPLDQRADLWSMGVVLWEALTGHSLFGARGDAEVASRVTSLAIPRPSDISRDVPAALDAITLKCLERDPDARFSSARELSSALEASCAAMGPRARMADVARWASEISSEQRERQLEMMRVARLGHAPPISLGAAPADVGYEETGARAVRRAAPTPAPHGNRGVEEGPTQAGRRLGAGGERGHAEPSRMLPLEPREPQERRDPSSRMRLLVVDDEPSPVAPRRRSAGLVAAIAVSALAMAGVAAGLTTWFNRPPLPAAVGAPPERPPVPSPMASQQPLTPTPSAVADLPPSVEPIGATPASAASPAVLTEAPPSSTVRRARPTARPTRPVLTREPPAVEVARPGQVYVEAEGFDADVYIGDRRLGSAPRRLSLPPGLHTLIIENRATGAHHPVRVDVQSGRLQFVSVGGG